MPTGVGGARHALERERTIAPTTHERCGLAKTPSPRADGVRESPRRLFGSYNGVDVGDDLRLDNLHLAHHSRPRGGGRGDGGRSGIVVAPAPSHSVVDASVRSRVVLHGLVLDVHGADWVGGPVLEVTLSDGTGYVRLAFLGRRRIGGIELGRALTVAGMVGMRRGRALLMNPHYWLDARKTEAPDA